MNKCKACNYSRMLYVRRGVKYFSEKKLYCTFHDKLLGAGDDCEAWQAQKIEYDLSSKRFDVVVDDIRALMKNLECIMRD